MGIDRYLCPFCHSSGHDGSGSSEEIDLSSMNHSYVNNRSSSRLHTGQNKSPPDTANNWYCCLNVYCFVVRRDVTIGHASMQNNPECDLVNAQQPNSSFVSPVTSQHEFNTKDGMTHIPDLNNGYGTKGTANNSSVFTIERDISQRRPIVNNNLSDNKDEDDINLQLFEPTMPDQDETIPMELSASKMLMTDNLRGRSSPTDGEVQPNFNFCLHMQESYRDVKADEAPDTKKGNCSFRRCRCLIIIGLLCMSIAGIIAATTLIQHLKNSTSDDYMNILPNINALLRDCSESRNVGEIGEHVCHAPNISCLKMLATEVLMNVTVTQMSSKYFRFVKKYFSIVFSEDQLKYIHDGWIVYYNESNVQQPLKIGKTNLTCQDIGSYRVTLQYDKRRDESCEFDIASSYPQLKLISSETEELVYVSCDLHEMCADAYLALYVNDGYSTYPILADDNKGCGKGGHIKTKEVALQKSMIAPNHTISCKPLTEDNQLTENLTTTLPLCEGRQCQTTCKEVEKGYYYQHPSQCNVYYQCEYPTLHLRPCPDNLQRNPKACSCDLAKNVADKCNNITKKYINQLHEVNIKGCGGQS